MLNKTQKDFIEASLRLVFNDIKNLQTSGDTFEDKIDALKAILDDKLYNLKKDVFKKLNLLDSIKKARFIRKYLKQYHYATSAPHVTQKLNETILKASRGDKERLEEILEVLQLTEPQVTQFMEILINGEILKLQNENDRKKKDLNVIPLLTAVCALMSQASSNTNNFFDSNSTNKNDGKYKYSHFKSNDLSEEEKTHIKNILKKTDFPLTLITACALTYLESYAQKLFDMNTPENNFDKCVSSFFNSNDNSPKLKDYEKYLSRLTKIKISIVFGVSISLIRSVNFHAMHGFNVHFEDASHDTKNKIDNILKEAKGLDGVIIEYKILEHDYSHNPTLFIDTSNCLRFAEWFEQKIQTVVLNRTSPQDNLITSLPTLSNSYDIPDEVD